MDASRRIYGIWLCFTLRLLFYAAMLPLWEGYDEWAHFAVIRTMATRGVLLVPRDAPVPRDVAASLVLAPVPWELRNFPAPSVTQDVFWKLPVDQRRDRQTAFREMPLAWHHQDGPPTLTAYEALQPPLYYWLMAVVLRLMDGCSLAAQVLAIRCLSALLASLALPLLYAVARKVFPGTDVALGCAAVAALMPGWALDVARVSNDSLSVVLFSLMMWFGLKLVEDARVRWAAGLGAVLGLGLLTKVWFLTAVPAIGLLFIWLWRSRCIAPAASAAAAGIVAAIAAAVSSWWYVYNLATTGTLSGLSESVMLRHTGVAAMASGALHVPWLRAIDSILLSHLYYGGWSSLTVRAWMYHLFYAVLLAAAIGLCTTVFVARALLRAAPAILPASRLGAAPLLRGAVRRSKPRRPAVGWLLAVYLAFWAGQLYNVVLLYLSKGVPTSMGWYLYAVIAAEVTLCVAGLRGLLPAKAGNWPLAGGVFLFALLDLYTMHAVAVPYYTGLIGHKASGMLAALHWTELHAAGWQEVVGRLTVFKGRLVTEPVLVALWIAYLLGTAWLVLAGCVGGSPDKRRDILR